MPSHAVGIARELRGLSDFFNTMLAKLERRDRGLRKAKAESANPRKSEFINHKSHELRPPLNAVIGLSEAMSCYLYGPLGDPRYRGYSDNSDNILESGNHLLEIVNDILDLAKIESGSVELSEEDVDFAAAVDACIALLGGRRVLPPSATSSKFS